MDKLKQAGKLALLQEEPNLALFDEIQSVSEKLRGIQGVLKSINVKEVKTYESELETLQNAIFSLTESVIDKDMVVNIPLDNLASQISKVEEAIKAIGVFKEMKIPEFPKELSLNEVQINEILLAIQSIPPFPYKELEKLLFTIKNSVEGIKLEIPEFDYERLDRKFYELVKAVKSISITVSSGGGGLNDNDRAILNLISKEETSADILLKTQAMVEQLQALYAKIPKLLTRPIIDQLMVVTDGNSTLYNYEYLNTSSSAKTMLWEGPVQTQQSHYLHRPLIGF